MIHRCLHNLRRWFRYVKLRNIRTGRDANRQGLSKKTLEEMERKGRIW